MILEETGIDVAVFFSASHRALHGKTVNIHREIRMQSSLVKFSNVKFFHAQGMRQI